MRRWTYRITLAAIAGIALSGTMASGNMAALAATEAPNSTPALAAASASRTEPRQDPARPVTQPAYPSDAFQKGEQGAVVLKFVVRADGTVDPATVKVEQGSGSASLDKAAVEEARSKWRFIPATEAGRPVSATHMFRVVFEIEEAPDQAKGTTIARVPGMIDVKKKFVADATNGTDKETKRVYQQGKTDGVYYRFYDDGSATFQTSAPGTDPVGTWNLTCGTAQNLKLCVARYYKLETVLVKDKGWLVSLVGQRKSACPIAFIPKDKSKEVQAVTMQGEVSGPAQFAGADANSLVAAMMEMESFVAPCGDEVIADPDMAMTPAPFPVVRRYMEWILNGQPAS